MLRGRIGVNGSVNLSQVEWFLKSFLVLRDLLLWLMLVWWVVNVSLLTIISNRFRWNSLLCLHFSQLWLIGSWVVFAIVQLNSWIFCFLIWSINALIHNSQHRFLMECAIAGGVTIELLDEVPLIKSLLSIFTGFERLRDPRDILLVQVHRASRF